jgi:hypothetical protein
MVSGGQLLAPAEAVAELVSPVGRTKSYRENYENDVGGRCDRPAGVRQ